MKNNLLDAYLDGFEMAKEMFVDSKKLSGFMMVLGLITLVLALL